MTAKERKALPASAGQKPDRTAAERIARAELMVSPSLKAAQVARKTLGYALGGAPEDGEILAELQCRIDEVQKEVKAGRLDFLESMLVAQACSLDAIFCQLSVMGLQADRANLQVVMGLALRAQGGARATVETIAAIKNPPGVVMVRQLNAAGLQQINNGPAPALPLACENTRAFSQNKVLEVMPHEPKRLDTGTPGADAGLDSLVGAVEEIDRPAHAGRQGPRVPQPVQRGKARRVAGRAPAHART